VRDLVMGCGGLRSAVDGPRLVVGLLCGVGLEILFAAALPADLVLGWVLVGGRDVGREVAAGR
jgi:hypothetical protein